MKYNRAYFNSTSRFVFNRIKRYSILLLTAIVLVACSDDDTPTPFEDIEGEKITIFFINDAHGMLENFSKIKHIVDAEKEETRTLLVSAGDMFSGSPYVDQYPERGFPMIDIMNQAGFDISVLGNHEFDYGLDILQERIDQSDFDWICANLDASGTALSQPEPYKTLVVDGIRVTFLGLIETYGREGVVAPAAHPWKMRGIEFQDHKDVVGQYATLKQEQNADVLIGLTHIGSIRDIALANANSFLDGIIGGHSNDINVNYFNNMPVLMAGANLQYMGKLELTINNKEVVASQVSMINLEVYESEDEDLAEAIETYITNPTFDTVVGSSETEMDRIGEVGCFYTTALKERLAVDLSIQNLGGLRHPIDQGDITKFEIFRMDPFNNQSAIYEMTAGEFKRFLRETSIDIAFSGIDIEFTGSGFELTDENGNEVEDSQVLRIGLNDFIPALYDDYFEFDQTEIRPLTTAEVLIEYLQQEQSTINFEGCDRTLVL